MPTGYTPIYRIYRGGLDITGQFNDRTTSIQIELTSGEGDNDKLNITVDDRDWAVARPYSGETLQVWLGYAEIGIAYMGTFEITDVTFTGKPRSIKLVGTSAGMSNIQKAPTIREFANKSVGSILEQFAEQSGLELSVSGDLAGKTIPFKNQVVSNYHLLHEMERLYGAVAKIQDGKLIFTKRDAAESASGITIPTLVLLPEHFGDWQVRYTERPGFGKVKAAWFDPEDMQRKWVDSSILGTNNLGGEGSFGGTFNIGQLFKSKEEAEAAAKSKGEALKRAEVQALFDLAKGDPWIRDQQTLLVSGMRDGINGSYVITKATHTYVKSTGIRSNLECKAPGDGADYVEASKEFMRPLPGEILGEYLRTHPDINPGDLSQSDIDAINEAGSIAN